MSGMELGPLVREARARAGISQLELARRAGVAAATVSRVEHGAREPSLAMVRRLLAAVGLQLHAELEPLDADLDAAIDQAGNEPVEDRLAFILWNCCDVLRELPHRVEGLSAASLFGVPVKPEHLEVAVLDADATLDVLERWHKALHLLISSGPGPFEGLSTNDLRGQLAERCPDGRFFVEQGFVTAWFRLADAEEVHRCVTISVADRLIRVQPPAEIGLTDPRAARLLARVLARQGTATQGRTPTGQDTPVPPSPQ